MPSPSFLRDIERFVDEYIGSYSTSYPDSRKIFHDALWGTQHLNSHELAVLDTPLIQRLRRIKQTAFAYLIFPSATHSRFEHTLGVIFQSNHLITALNQNPRYRNFIKGKENLIRMAALLHDCGHGPFSHSTEEIYKFLPDMEELVGPQGEHEDRNPHEVLAHYIVKSETFKKFFRKVTKKYSVDIDIDEIADIILGEWDEPKTKYLQDIINGPFDADKLDYIFRDGHFSGLPLRIDLDRLWYSVQIEMLSRPSRIRMLVMSINGTTPLEQILFSKMVLFTSLYQHHKARTCDCMLKAIFEYCKDHNIKLCGKSFNKSTDFLWLTDDKIYAEADKRRKNDPLHKLIHDLKYRRLLKRALVISKATVKEESQRFFGHTSLKKKCIEWKNKDPELRKLAKTIWEEAGRPCKLHEVWVDIPKFPPIGSADDTYINKGTYKKPNFVKLKDIFRIDDWALDYVEHNWRGHVFCPDDISVRKRISKAARSVLQKEFDIFFDEAAWRLCKL